MSARLAREGAKGGGAGVVPHFCVSSAIVDDSCKLARHECVCRTRHCRKSHFCRRQRRYERECRRGEARTRLMIELLMVRNGLAFDRRGGLGSVPCARKELARPTDFRQTERVLRTLRFMRAVCRRAFSTSRLCLRPGLCPISFYC
jgi:hypothetical protein